MADGLESNKSTGIFFNAPGTSMIVMEPRSKTRPY